VAAGLGNRITQIKRGESGSNASPELYDGLCVILFAVISIYIAAKQQASTLAKMIIAFFAGAYILRIILGIVVFGLSFSEVMAWLVCAAATACYLLALKKPAPIK
jgi:F0F1-type ATP synthase assembly protein I